MKATAQKCGNSLSICVPKSVAVHVRLKAQVDSEIELQDGNVLLKPQLRQVHHLTDIPDRRDIV